MSNGVHEANEPTLVGSQSGMALGNGADEESYSTVTLVCPNVTWGIHYGRRKAAGAG